MKMRHIKANKAVLCVSPQGQIYKLPQAILKKYIVDDANKIITSKKDTHKILTPEEAFAELNAKYTKAGALLKAVRLREGISQKEFAMLINVTQGDLSKMENGKRPIGKILAARIAKKFKSKII